VCLNLQKTDEFEVLNFATPAGHVKWLDLWNSWSGHEVFAHPHYVKLFAGPFDQIMCATALTGNGGILYPFILRPLSTEPWFNASDNLWDLSTPYGYGGAFAWSITDRDCLVFWRNMEKWVGEHRVVSSFARLSLFPDQIIPFHGEVELKAPNVVRTLDLDEENLWRDYAHKVRKNVNRARREGITIELAENGNRLEDFLRIYLSTMDRRGASRGYYFPRDFFYGIIEELKGQFAFFHALKSGVVVSTELVLISANHVYSFLGGTQLEAFECRPNDLIKHEIIEWSRKIGKKAFVLGGGYEVRDGIFLYKLSFAPRGERPFCVGTKIHDSEAYEKLLLLRRNWELSMGKLWNPKPGYFPIYRA